MAHNDEPCVTDDELRQLEEKKLSPVRAKALLQKINGCVYCKRRWLLGPTKKVGESK